MNLCITPEQANSRCYRKALQEELAIGQASDEASLAMSRINRPEILAYKARMLGNRDSYSDYADWTRFLISEYGRRERCLSLGSGIGRVEKYLVSQGFTDTMETIELCAEVNEDIRIKDRRIDTLPGDLNFVQLPENAYDFVLCHGVLHHLINLEHVLDQINRSLKPDGLFLAYEYVGETRWQFSDERLRFLTERFPGVGFRRRPLWRIPGFESVRSADLLGLIRHQFGDRCDRSVSYGGVYFPWVICTAARNDSRLDEVVRLDETVAGDNSLPPCYHMGLYRKSTRPPATARPWSMQELETRLSPSAPLGHRIREFAKGSPLGPLLRSMRRRVAGR
jgi:SAM-dependent methyltransferase